ncbi:hypothetical protein EUGRSUZ_E00186 [Eucalyptus grandis]|uniref:Uncharacterized protein n=2 Tax=Eucalyptus grandis TaxID=71139 RepID=A0ACC3KQI6_EUCGR|nr:hypothetical protein EUGRSUZ_E00186 [Eucalyptus grandis]
MEHERRAVLPAQALEAQHRHRHVRRLPRLHPHRHDVRQARGFEVCEILSGEISSCLEESNVAERCLLCFNGLISLFAPFLHNSGARTLVTRSTEEVCDDK